LWRKCPYKEIVPEILTATPKSAGKNMKNCAIASFHEEQSDHQFSKQVIDRFSRKKMLNIDPNQGIWSGLINFDVTLSKMNNFTLVVQVTPMSYCSHKKWAQKSTDLHRLNVSTTQRRQNQSTCFFL
jgi:hypothetical protein